MNREFLEELLKVIEDEPSRKEMIDKIMDENGKSINAGKAKIEELTKQLGLKTTEGEETARLLEDLKKSSAGNEENLNKIKAYEEQVATLQKELEEAKVDSALKVALANAKVTDVDYITYKIKEKGELKLDDEGNIKGIDDTLKEVKTSFPSFFETEKKKEIEVKDLGTGKVGTPEPTNLAEALKQQYSQKENKM